MKNDALLRDHIIALLRGGNAHVSASRALAGIPTAARGKRPRGVAHSPWDILEHLRLTQVDIIEYVRDPAYVSPAWPAGYWPGTPSPPDARAWKRSLDAFHADLATVEAMVADPTMDLLAQIPHGQPGHTILREALLVADHNAYHAAEMVLVRRLLGVWK